MNTTTCLVPVTVEQHPVVERLWQLYSHDMSEFRGSMPDEQGLYRAGRLPSYLSDADRCIYLICRGSTPAGFVMVRGLGGQGPLVVGEFFVVRAARRQGVGFDAARQLFRMMPGRWEIAFQEENPGAARFWRAIATDVAGTTWTVESRPVPGKPEIPPDSWLSLSS